MKRSRPRPFSKRREAEREERRAVVERVLARDGHRCQARYLGLAPGCGSAVLDVHEIISRAVWRAGYLLDANCLTLDRTHHGFVDDQPILAECAGLRVPRHVFDLYGADQALQMAAVLRSLLLAGMATFPPWFDDEQRTIAAERDSRWVTPLDFQWAQIGTS